jgi:hypothetical protein
VYTASVDEVESALQHHSNHLIMFNSTPHMYAIHVRAKCKNISAVAALEHSLVLYHAHVHAEPCMQYHAFACFTRHKTPDQLPAQVMRSKTLLAPHTCIVYYSKHRLLISSVIWQHLENKLHVICCRASRQCYTCS